MVRARRCGRATSHCWRRPERNSWRYERALEAKRISVASQAGKTLMLRQETQDVLALLRTLADLRDTLAFGALMRGPPGRPDRRRASAHHSRLAGGDRIQRQDEPGKRHAPAGAIGPRETSAPEVARTCDDAFAASQRGD